MKQKDKFCKEPVITNVEKSLDQYLTEDLFKEKLANANQILKTTKLPEFTK